ncbi:App1 family protein [Aridibaculum aurantiacum]|uniref:App1 family protein n=1 Tax=Aridibaculum aurantiacum TaxID=2810307 RepID=UPI001A968CC2|nr:phosphatase domain-containing protein [Aridibaculum aurantiacum]
MASIKKNIIRTASAIEDRWDELRFNIKRRLGLNDPVQIVPYRTYGTADRVYIKGRVLEDKKIASADDKDTVWNNLLNMYKRFESDEVPDAKLKAILPGEEYEVTTDKEGYFVLNIHPKTSIINEDLWHPITVELLHAPIPYKQGLQATAEVMIPPIDAEYGIISDIDDTIVETTATNLLAMSRTTFLNNAKTRLPFAGVSEFYRSLQLGRNGKKNNPFFYVSSSPWNLYDLLTDFLDLNDIPEGPIMLRDFGLDEDSVKGNDHLGHKLKEIRQIMHSYPQLQFILIGDSGQEDPVIYREVVKEFPGRILAIYIRDVKLEKRKKVAVEVSASVKEHEVEMLIVADTVEAAEHAAQNGLIFTEAIPAIEHDKEEDKGEAPGKEEATIL